MLLPVMTCRADGAGEPSFKISRHGFPNRNVRLDSRPRVQGVLKFTAVVKNRTKACRLLTGLARGLARLRTLQGQLTAWRQLQ